MSKFKNLSKITDQISVIYALLTPLLLLSSFHLYALELSQEERLASISPAVIQDQLESIIAPHAQCFQAQDPTSLYDRFPQKIMQIKEMLFSDKTDSIPYQLPVFTCHNYSKVLFLQHSDQIKELEGYRLDDIKQQWGVTIQRDENEPKFSIFTVNLASADEGYFHAINAVLLDKENPQDINSYLFIEPQSDKLLLASELREHGNKLMHKEMTAPIKVNIATFDAFNFTGSIWQGVSTTAQDFIDN